MQMIPLGLSGLRRLADSLADPFRPCDRMLEVWPLLATPESVQVRRFHGDIHAVAQGRSLGDCFGGCKADSG